MTCNLFILPSASRPASCSIVLSYVREKPGKFFGIFGRASKSRSLVSPSEVSHGAPQRILGNGGGKFARSLIGTLATSAAGQFTGHARVPDAGSGGGRLFRMQRESLPLPGAQ